LRRCKVTPLSRFVLQQRHTLDRIPGLLALEAEETDVLRQLIGFRLGNPTDKVPQCSVLWVPGLQSYASALYLGGCWAVTAGHAVTLEVPYQLSVPVQRVTDITHANSFDAVPLRAPSSDLALLQLSGIPPLAGLSLASDAELQQAGSVQLCGFGSNDCEDESLAGFRRLSDPYPIVSNPAALGINIDPATQFVVRKTPGAPLVCDSDSGGGALIPTNDGNFKLTGIITDQLFTAQLNKV
jgi:hypothetical protein